MSSIRKQLNLPTLAQRRKQNRLILMYKAFEESSNRLILVYKAFEKAVLSLKDLNCPTRTNRHKEVFVKHEQAPSAPKLEGVWVFFFFFFFLQILNIFSMKTAIFGQFDNFRSGVFDRNGQQDCPRTVCHTLHNFRQPLFL